MPDGSQNMGEPAFSSTGSSKFGIDAKCKLYRQRRAGIFGYACHDWTSYELAGAAGVDELMLIGGAQLYETLLPRCDRLYVTRVDAEVGGDAVFPEIDLAEWLLTGEDAPQKGPKDEFSFQVAVFDRIN